MWSLAQKLIATVYRAVSTMLPFAASLPTQLAAATQALPLGHRKRPIVSNIVSLRQRVKTYALNICTMCISGLSCANCVPLTPAITPQSMANNSGFISLFQYTHHLMNHGARNGTLYQLDAGPT